MAKVGAAAQTVLHQSRASGLSCRNNCFMEFSEGKFGSSPEVARMPDRILEGGSMVEQLKQMVTSYEVLANVPAPMDCDPLPPKYEEDNELLPPKYEQELLKEEQQCEKELPGNGQHGVNMATRRTHIVSRRNLPPQSLRWRERATQGPLTP